MSNFTPTLESEIITTPAAELVPFEPHPLDRNPAAVYLAGLGSMRSRNTQRQALEVIARILTGSPDILACNWAGLRFAHTQAIRSRLAESYSAATANRLLSALRGVLKAAWGLGLIGAEDMAKAINFKPVKGSTLPTGRALGQGEIAALMANCEDDPTPAGARDAAMIAVMYPGGLRREEVTNLDLSDYDPESGALTVRHGKGNKARITYMTNGAAGALADWLAIRGEEPGALFWPILKSKVDKKTGKLINGGKLQPRRMTHQAIYNALAKRGELARVKDFSPHDLRRTFISDLLDAGADIATVAKLAGHASITTTQRYDRRPEAAKQKAAQLLHLPYRRRLV